MEINPPNSIANQSNLAGVHPRTVIFFLSYSFRSHAARFRSPPFVRLITPQLNAARSLKNWLRTIWEFAKETHLVRNDLIPEKITDEELEIVWRKMFKGVESIVLAEFIDTQKLLKWLKTSKGRNHFAKILTQRTSRANQHA